MDIKIHHYNNTSFWVYKDFSSVEARSPANIYYILSNGRIYKKIAIPYCRSMHKPQIIFEKLPALFQEEIAKDFPELAAPDELDEFVNNYKMS